MRLFTPRHTPSENIAFLALMSAVNALVSVLISFVPLSDIVVLLFLPLASALVGELCEGRYLPVYLFASMGVSIATTAYDFQATLFYVIPAILSGTLYGFLHKKKAPTPYVVFGVSLLQLALNYLSLPLIKAIYQSDLIAFFLQVFQLSNRTYIHDIIPLFLFAYSLAATALSHFLIQGFFNRFKAEENVTLKWPLSYPIIGICGVFAAFGLAFLQVSVAYLFLGIALYFSAWSIALLKTRFPWGIYLGYALLTGLSFFLFALLYRQFPADSGLILLGLFLLAFDTPTLLGRLLLLKELKTPLK